MRKHLKRKWSVYRLTTPIHTRFMPDGCSYVVSFGDMSRLGRLFTKFNEWVDVKKLRGRMTQKEAREYIKNVNDLKFIHES